MPNDAAGTTHQSRGASLPPSPAAASAVDNNGNAPTMPPSPPMDDLDEYVWTSPSPPLSASDPLHAALRDFDRDLRCPVCHDFYRIPVSLPNCHHTFCSECIRVSLRASVKVRRVSECPVCRQRADERRVVPNRCVEGIVRRFVELRGGLRERLMAAAAVDAVGTAGRAGGSDAASAGSRSRGGEVVEAGCEGDEGGEEIAGQSPASAASSASAGGGGRRTSSRVSSRRAAAASASAPAAADDEIFDDGDSDFEESPARRSPPTTTKAMAAKRGRGRPPKNRPSPPPPPGAAVVGTVPRRRTSTHYHGLKRKQLVDLLAREGLSTAGTEREMRDRHAEFVTLVNSECDAERPRSEEELRAELARRERARREERAASMHNGAMRDAECMERLKRARKAAGEAEAAVEVGGVAGRAGPSATSSTNGPSPFTSSVAVSSGNAAFDGALDAGFRRLIADARRKRRRLKEGDGDGDGGGEATTGAAERGLEGAAAAGEPGELPGGADDAAGGGATPADADAHASRPTPAETTAAALRSPATSASSLPVLDSSSSHAAVVVRPPAAATTPGGGGGNEGSMTAPISSQKEPRADVGRGRGPARPLGQSPAGGSATAAASSSPPAASASAGGSISGPWNCGTCTFLNTVRVWTNARCEMCEVGRRPGPGGCRRSGRPEHVVEVDC